MKWHPDKHANKKEEATTKFQEIAEAYETLTDFEKRKLYDLGGEEAVRGQPSPQGEERSAGSGRPGAGHTFHFNTGSNPGAQGSRMDSKMFEEAFAQMFGGGAAGRGQRFFSGGGMHNSRPRQTKQGGPLFVDTSVQEFSFDQHEAQIKALTQKGPAVILFYTSGGKSCPTACHRIKDEIVALAKAYNKQVPVAAVKCERRKGRCADHADSFPAVLYFEKGAIKRHVLSVGEVVTAKDLQKKLAAHLAQQHGAKELRREHFAYGADPCDGQFCLLLLERGPRSKTESARKVLKAAAELLQHDPVKAFYVRADEHEDFAKKFEDAHSSVPSFLGGLRRLPSARFVLYRPKRKSFAVFEGKVEDAAALAEFASRVINMGVPLPHKLGNVASM